MSTDSNSTLDNAVLQQHPTGQFNVSNSSASFCTIEESDPATQQVSNLITGTGVNISDKKIKNTVLNEKLLSYFRLENIASLDFKSVVNPEFLGLNNSEKIFNQRMD